MTLQLNFFTKYFDPNDYEWFPALGVKNRKCHAEIYIPEKLYSPLEITENTGFRYVSDEYKEMADRWGAHMHGIASLVPDELRSEYNNANGWQTAQKLFKEHRENRKPIKVEIWDWDIEYFRETEVVL